MKKKEFITDTESGIRRINEIRNLPVKELTDEEIVKLFFHRVNADSLLFYYQDKTGERYLFGRTRTRKNMIANYKNLLRWIHGFGFHLFERNNIKSVDYDSCEKGA